MERLILFLQELYRKFLLALKAEELGSIAAVVTIIFYIALVVFLLLWLMEKLLKLANRVLGRAHPGLKGKKAAETAFWASLILKGAVFALTLGALLSRSLSMSRFFREYIKSPENLWELIKRDKLFLAIFVAFVTIKLLLHRRRGELKEHELA